MNTLFILSILMLIIGGGLSLFGIILMAITNEPYTWSTISILFGVLSLIGASIIISISKQYIQ